MSSSASNPQYAKTWLAPAKLNLFLHITGRRDDGMHLLQTVFQLLDYADELRFSVLPNGEVRHKQLPAEFDAESELCVRAARLLQQHCACTLGVEIDLRKRIPLGAGLGGGSSNAATTLLALNQLWQLGLDTQQLLDLGLSLGADVPVFVARSSAWAQGVGEELQPVELPECWFLVIFPNIFVETRKIFMAPQLTRNAAPITIADFLQQSTQCSELFGTNNCQAVVFEQYPQVAEAYNWLNQELQQLLHRDGQARLTGTGASVFARLASAQQAEQVLARVPDKWLAFVAKGVNRSVISI